MLTQNYGGFTPTLPAIDIRFTSIEQYDHFEEAWSLPGRRPSLPQNAAKRRDLLSIGTVIEHELRHFHDYLINRDLLQTSWLRRRMFMNVMPVIANLLRSTEHDVIPFPIMKWAGFPSTRRTALQHELQQLFPAGRDRFWSPKLLRRNFRPHSSRAMPAAISREQAAEQERLILQAVQADWSALTPLRHGLDPTPVDRLRFTPRFAFEFSALNTQLQAVFKTYGINEGFEFIQHLAEEGTTFARFFFDILTFFGSKGRYEGFTPEGIDYPKLNVVAFWIMTGCAKDGSKAGPSTRLSTLIEAARENWADVFPENIEPIELIGHFDRKAGVTEFRESLHATQQELDDQLAAAIQLYGSNPKQADFQLRSVQTFSAVLECRRQLVAQIIDDPIRFIDPCIWMKDLKVWPECPVHLRFGRMGVEREKFKNFPADAIYNMVTNLDDEAGKKWVGDVYLSSFFGNARIPLRPIAEQQQQFLLFDLLLEPEQISAWEDNAVRGFVREQFGKELVRII